MAINSSTTMSANVFQLFYDKKLLSRLTKNLVLEPLCARSLNVPKGVGDQVKWLRYGELHVTDPTLLRLNQGVIGSDQSITTNNVTATALEYGNFSVITDVLDWIAVDFNMANKSVIENIMGVLGDQGAELIDVIIRNEATANFPEQFANGKASLATTGVDDVMTVKEGLKAMITLKKNSVGKHESGSYVCVIHPASEGDVMNDTNTGSWVDINKYVGMAPLNGEIGRAYGVRYLSSDNMFSTATGTLGGATVYSNLFFGADAIGVAKLGDKSVQTYVKRSGPDTTSDPLNQIATAGYKVLGYVAKYLGGSGNGTADRGIEIRCGSGF